MKIQDGEETKELLIQTSQNRLFFQVDDRRENLFAFEPENWNYLKVLYKDGRISLSITYSCKCSKVATIYQADPKASEKLLAIVSHTEYGVAKSFHKIEDTEEEKALKFMAQSSFPPIQMSNLYFDYFDDFMSTCLAKPEFLNSNFVKPSNNFKVIKDNRRNVIFSNDYFLSPEENVSFSIKFNKSPVRYRLLHLMNFTIINYFSNHMINIPPDSYIKAGHSTGSKVIGTISFLKEENIYDLLIEDLESETKPLMKKLVRVMESKGFDGYLLMFFKETKKPEEVVEWIREFSLRVKAASNEYLLIYLDSLTNEGTFNPQGEVNEKNIDFVETTDLFYSPYRWNENTIKKSVDLVNANKMVQRIDVFKQEPTTGQSKAANSAKLLKESGASVALVASSFSNERAFRDRNEEIAFSNELRMWNEAKITPVYNFDLASEPKGAAEKAQQTENKRNGVASVAAQTDVGLSENNVSRDSHTIQFKKEIYKNLKAFDFFLDVKFKAGDIKLKWSKYIVVVNFKSDNNLVGCIDSVKRKFLYNTKQNSPCYIKPSESILFSKADSSKQDQSKIPNHGVQTEKLFVEKEKIYNIARYIDTIEVSVFAANASDKAAILSVGVNELEFQKDGLLEQLVEKAVVNLPVTSFFNTGSCDIVSFKGGRTTLKGYNYIYDYDINVDFIQDQIPIKQHNLLSLASKPDMHIDQSMSFYGCTSLRVSAVLNKSSYLSNQLYKIDVPQNRVSVKIVYHLYESVSKYFDFEFHLITEQGEIVEPLVVDEERANTEEAPIIQSLANWRERTISFKNNKGPLQLVVFAIGKKDQMTMYQSLMFFINIGQVSIYDSNVDLSIDYSKIFDLKYETRYSLTKSSNPKTKIVDLYLKATQLETKFRIRNYVLFQKKPNTGRRGLQFVANVYYKEFILKNLIFQPEDNGCEVYRLMAITEDGEFLHDYQTITICEWDIKPIDFSK